MTANFAHRTDEPIAIDVDDPRTDDVRALLQRHLEFSRGVTPAAYSFALDVDELVDPGVTFFSARRTGVLLGVGAMKELDPRHGELKSMHTASEARRQGVGRAMVDHLLAEGRRRGYERVSLETGSMDVFAPARMLYTSFGFRPCGPFGGYRNSDYNVFMALDL